MTTANLSSINVGIDVGKDRSMSMSANWTRLSVSRIPPKARSVSLKRCNRM